MQMVPRVPVTRPVKRSVLPEKGKVTVLAKLAIVQKLASVLMENVTTTLKKSNFSERERIQWVGPLLSARFSSLPEHPFLRP